MKKIVKQAIALTLAVPILAVSVIAADLGDINNDGSITTDDAALSLQATLNGTTSALENADIDGDGIVNSYDTAEILQKALDSSYNYGNKPDTPTPTPDIEADITVDRSIAESDPANNLYKTVQEAYEAAPAGTEENPTVIKINPGVYLMNGDETKNGLSIKKDYLTFIGATGNANDVVLADNRGNNQGASSNANSASVVSSCTGLTLKNLSIYNYCNVDVPFELDPSQALTKRSSLETQAFAYMGAGDKHFYENCQFISILDTFENDVTRAYYKNCYVQGSNDFIMGWGGTQVFDGCTINSLSNYIVGGATRVLFKDCTFQHNKSSNAEPTYLCKGLTDIALINCQVPTDQCVYQWTNGLPDQYKFQYYNLTDSTGAKTTVVDDSCGLELTPEQVEAYNLWNVLRGSDDWDPAGVKDIYADKGSEPMIVNVNSSATVKTGESSATISASVYPSRADQSVTFTAEGDITIEQNGRNCTITATNESLDVTKAIVTVTASNGIKNKTVVTVQPRIAEPPTFAKAIEILDPADGAISVNYELNLGVASSDTSLISWYRCDDANGTNPIIVADTKMDEPTKSYALSSGDVGKYMMVTVSPKSELSNVGEEVSAIYPVEITADMINKNISTNFQNVVTHPPFIDSSTLGSTIDNGDGTTTLYRNLLETSIPDTVPGKWNFIGDWYYNYGSGTYASLVKGVITGTRYGRAIYTQPEANYGDMTAVVSFTPEKNAGQGFGSALQYQELLIKYDPETQTGYGIRYTRSNNSELGSNAIEFQLYEYLNGVGTPIGDMQSWSGKFRSNCTITLTSKGTELYVKVETDLTETDEVTGEAITVPPLEFTGTMSTPNNYGGFGIYHAGTTGGRFVFTNVDITYE